MTTTFHRSHGSEWQPYWSDGFMPRPALVTAWRVGTINAESLVEKTLWYWGLTLVARG